MSSGLKGSGDYGLFGLGIYNGQLANSPELNNSPHVVTRFTYPMELKNQIIEFGISGYSGQYLLANSAISSGVIVDPDNSYTDQRVAASFVLYPQPLGFVAEYNIGRGPEYDKSLNAITTQNLNGGFILASYMLK